MMNQYNYRTKPTSRKYHKDSKRCSKNDTKVQVIDKNHKYNIAFASEADSDKEKRDVMIQYWHHMHNTYISSLSSAQVNKKTSELFDKKVEYLLSYLVYELKNDTLYCIKDEAMGDHWVRPKDWIEHAHDNRGYCLTTFPAILKESFRIFIISEILQNNLKEGMRILIDSCRIYERSQVMIFAIERFNQFSIQINSEDLQNFIGSAIRCKYSSDILLKISLEDERFRKTLIEYCSQNFYSLLNSPYSPRMMKLLIDRFSEFRIFSIWFFKKNFHLCLKNFNAAFLMTIAIKSSESEGEYKFIKDILLINKKSHLNSKYFKRLLVSYIEYCSEQELENMRNLLEIETHFHDYLNDQFKTFIILMFLKRGLNSFLCFFLRQLTSKFDWLLIKARCFKLLMTKCITIKDLNTRQVIHNALLNLHHATIKEITINRNLKFFYYYLTIRMSPADKLSEVQSYLCNTFGEIIPKKKKTRQITPFE